MSAHAFRGRLLSSRRKVRYSARSGNTTRGGDLRGVKGTANLRQLCAQLAVHRHAESTYQPQGDEHNQHEAECTAKSNAAVRSVAVVTTSAA